MVLAVTFPGDVHARHVLAALARLGEPAVELDLADLPCAGTVLLTYGDAPRAAEIRLEGRPPVRAEDVTAVWWRRPRQFVAAGSVAPQHAGWAERQTAEAVMGFLASLEAPFVNHPWRDEVASHKTHQLALAERSGLTVPRTCVTGEPDAARAFLAAVGAAGAIHKPLHVTPEDFRPTRLVSAKDLERLDALRLAPAIFQEYVPGVDVRVTIAGEALHAAEIDARATRSPEDFRDVFDESRVAACTLPEAVASRLRRLVAHLGLAYAAIDLRRRENGTFVFLELNPAGQWYFVEERTGQPITDAVAMMLARRVNARVE